MVNSKELIGATEAVTLETRCLIKRCRYKRGRLYIPDYTAVEILHLRSERARMIELIVS
jgi:hypothetical protein